MATTLDMVKGEESKQRILIVDDEADIGEIISFNLEYEGYDTVTAYSAEEALDKLDTTFDLIILDVMMGGMSGFQMADQLRKEDNMIPIIFLTAKDTENDMLTGFSIGGDDYVKKPFSVKEIVARVKSVLKRVTSLRQPSNTTDLLSADGEQDRHEDKLIICGPLIIDTENMTVSDGTEVKDVTKTEYEIIKLLANNIGRPFSRSEILNHVWHDDGIVLERTIDVHIARIRKKLGIYGDLIVNRVGFGYAMKLPKE